MPGRKAFAVLPTLLTLGNAACGFGAITIAAKVGPVSANAGNDELLVSNELLIASLLIFLAMLFDVLDGAAARLTKQASDFGAELDSLCDAISFGVAPAFLMLQFSHPQHNLIKSATYHPRILWVIGVLFALCAVLRLARFNVETDEDDSHEFFSGLPSPAAAGAVASFPIALYGLGDLAARNLVEVLLQFFAAALPLITLGLAFLMVSRIRYPHFFNQILRRQRSRQQVLQIVFTIALVFLVREMALPVVLCYFAFAAPLRAFWTEFLAGRLHKSARR